MLGLRFTLGAARGALYPSALLFFACGPQVELETDTTSDSSGPVSETDTTTAPTTVATTVGPGTDPTVDPDGGTDGPAPTVRAVDILFVVDNSGSMGEEQAKLATSIASLLEVLDTAEPPVDYRIGVTTTDNGNPWCGATTPEAGHLRAISCRLRANEFVFDGAVPIDATAVACYDICALGDLGITDGRPWIDVQRTTGTTNTSNEITQTLACMLPQGINGCGFESPLESLWKALRRSEDENESEYGFHREGALLAVAIVTDEEDCSYNTEWESIFLPDGNRVFWSDPMAAAPTSAVCWNAGVACTGDAELQCQAESYDVDGNPGASDDDAVLRPLARYVDDLLVTGAYVIAIDGVGLDGSVTYAPSLSNPQFQNDFGIGPGCESEDGLAVPPVRIREMIETTSGDGNEFSVCAPELDVAMSSFGQGILGRLP